MDRQVHAQRTAARRRNEPGGEYGTIAWEEHVEACAAIGTNPEREAARGGYDYAAICLMLGREPRTWRKWTDKARRG